MPVKLGQETCGIHMLSLSMLHMLSCSRAHLEMAAAASKKQHRLHIKTNAVRSAYCWQLARRAAPLELQRQARGRAAVPPLMRQPALARAR